MRPAEERSTHGYWDGGDDRPDPLVAQSAPEFVAQLRALVHWSGLSLDEIEQLARANGDILPPSIVSAALSHNTLPPEEVVVALVAAIGDDEEMVELWASVLWRLEDMGAAAATTMNPPATRAVTQAMAPPGMGPPGMAPPGMAPHSAPLPPPPPGSPVTGPVGGSARGQAGSVGGQARGHGGGSRQYSGGSLAQAVQRRQNQSSWTGLHRGFQKGLRATGDGSRFGRWPVAAAIGATVFVLIAGVTWAVAGGGGEGDNQAEPRTNPCCSEGTGAAAPPGGPSEGILPSELTVELPPPGADTRTTPTPKVTTTSPRDSPSPARTQTPNNPSLSSTVGSSCSSNGTDWVVSLSVSVTLSGAPVGNDPQGQAGKPGDLRPFVMNGGGTALFSGQTPPIVVGSAADPAPAGSLQWRVTVSVAGFDPVQTSGSEPYSCG